MNDWTNVTIALCAAIPITAGATVMLLKGIFVTRAELRQTLKDRANVDDTRHKENVERFGKQDTMLGDIRSSVARIEGQLSGRYPRIRE
jgi:hypothetical protein